MATYFHKDKGKAKLIVEDHHQEVISLDEFSDDDQIQIQLRPTKKPCVIVDISDDEDEQNDVVSTFICDICTETKSKNSSFNIKGCSHHYCSECVTNYVASKLEYGIVSLNCPVPACSGSLDPEYCRDILPPEVIFRWGKQLCEASIVASQKFYCPFKDCSAMLVDDGGEIVTRAECPHCNRLFCAKCKAAWHDVVDCEEFQKVNEDERESGDLLLRKLAKEKGWDRCTRCGFYVEKIMGCNSIYCRNCHNSFIYGAGGLQNRNPTFPPFATNYHLQLHNLASKTGSTMPNFGSTFPHFRPLSQQLNLRAASTMPSSSFTHAPLSSNPRWYNSTGATTSRPGLASSNRITTYLRGHKKTTMPMPMSSSSGVSTSYPRSFI